MIKYTDEKTKLIFLRKSISHLLEFLFTLLSLVSCCFLYFFKDLNLDLGKSIFKIDTLRGIYKYTNYLILTLLITGTTFYFVNLVHLFSIFIIQLLQPCIG